MYEYIKTYICEAYIVGLTIDDISGRHAHAHTISLSNFLGSASLFALSIPTLVANAQCNTPHARPLVIACRVSLFAVNSLIRIHNTARNLSVPRFWGGINWVNAPFSTSPVDFALGKFVCCRSCSWSASQRGCGGALGLC